MKTVVSILLAIYCFAPASLFATQADTVNVPLIQQPPVFDGDETDPCWQKTDWQTIDQVWITWGESVSQDDYQGRYKVVWSEATNLLYFFVEVYDDVAVDGFRSGITAGAHNFDVVEVFIDADKSGGLHVFDGTGSTGREWGTNAENAFSYHLYADFPADGLTSPLSHVADIAGTGWNDQIDPNYIGHFPDFVLKKQGNRYTREFSLKVFDDTYENNNPEASRVQLSAGRIMGLSMAVCDNDDLNENPAERDNFFGSVWVPESEYNDHWINADGYGTMQLAGSTTLVAENQTAVTTPHMSVYPNPVTNFSSLRLTDPYRGPVNITIYNILGQTVFSRTQQKSTAEFTAALPLDFLRTGYYLIDVRMHNQHVTQKIYKL